MKSALLELKISVVRKTMIWSALWLQSLLKKRTAEQIRKNEQKKFIMLNKDHVLLINWARKQAKKNDSEVRFLLDTIVSLVFVDCGTVQTDKV